MHINIYLILRINIDIFSLFTIDYFTLLWKNKVNKIINKVYKRSLTDFKYYFISTINWISKAKIINRIISKNRRIRTKYIAFVTILVLANHYFELRNIVLDSDLVLEICFCLFRFRLACSDDRRSPGRSCTLVHDKIQKWSLAGEEHFLPDNFPLYFSVGVSGADSINPSVSSENVACTKNIQCMIILIYQTQVSYFLAL